MSVFTKMMFQRWHEQYVDSESVEINLTDTWFITMFTTLFQLL